ncbi:hypothetical protein [Pedobacter frigoris]|uniref:Protein BatD n=1 Tax=Pedobacter frigoris TaxID=2571272 RepID=A0A4U1CJM8_9SPHI|nr:hypothetical protein [Pedobacter frigoris]TKC06306.1 hypothetical protein FA047_13420 [Pedobacter frigoris]
MKLYFNFCWCLLLCFTCFIGKGYAQQVAVEAKLDKSTIALGDQTILRLIARLPTAQQISFPTLTDTISSKIQIVEIGKTDTLKDTSNPAVHTLSRSYVITSFDAGIQVIPSFVFQTKGASFSTVSMPLEVKSVKVDTTKAIFDIKQPIAVSYTLMDWLRDNWHWVVFAVVCLLMLGGALYYYMKVRKVKPVQVIQEKPAVPPHLIAMEKLKELRNKKLWQQDAIKQYHSELSDVIREYLEKRYGISALEQTSDEILSGLKSREINEEDRNILRQVLQLADLVKFAKATPLNTENELSMNNAISFVTRTRVLSPVVENKTDQRNESV